MSNKNYNNSFLYSWISIIGPLVRVLFPFQFKIIQRKTLKKAVFVGVHDMIMVI